MLETFFATLSPMLVMMVCIFIGFLLKKTKVEPDNTGVVLSKLEAYVLQPARILSTFVAYCTIETLTKNSRLIFYGAVTTVLSYVLGFALRGFFAKKGYMRRVFQYALTVANYGFLGNAIVPQILGEEMLYLYMLFVMPLHLLVYGWAIGTLIPEDKGKKSVVQRFFNPIIVSVLVGIVLGLTGIGKILPGFINTTLNNLAACMGPVAMILTGFIIGGFKLKDLVCDKRVYIVTGLRLIVLPAVIMGVMYLLGADKTTLILTLFTTCTALGLNTVVYPAAYGGDTKPGAAMALISHAGCIVSIPLMYALLSWLL